MTTGLWRNTEPSLSYTCVHVIAMEVKYVICSKTHVRASYVLTMHLNQRWLDVRCDSACAHQSVKSVRPLQRIVVVFVICVYAAHRYGYVFHVVCRPFHTRTLTRRPTAIEVRVVFALLLPTKTIAFYAVWHILPLTLVATCGVKRSRSISVSMKYSQKNSQQDLYPRRHFVVAHARRPLNFWLSGTILSSNAN